VVISTGVSSNEAAPAARGAGADRRVRRTRTAIRNALLELCVEREFSALTVEDVLERADIARATFYAHYRSKEDVLVDLAHKLASDRAGRIAQHEAKHPEGFTGDPVRIVFEHAQAHRDVYLVILQGAGDGRALREFFDLTSRQAEALFRARAEHAGVEPRVPLPLVARAWAGEVIGTLVWWLSEDTGLPADEVAALLSDLSVRGRRWASGSSED